MDFPDIPFLRFRIQAFQPSRRISAGKSAVVKNPHLHPQLFRFRDNNIQITPPAIAQEIRMRPGLHDKAVDAAFPHPMHFFFQYRFRFPVLPEKGPDIACIHRNPPSTSFHPGVYTQGFQPLRPSFLSRPYPATPFGMLPIRQSFSALSQIYTAGHFHTPSDLVRYPRKY